MTGMAAGQDTLFSELLACMEVVAAQEAVQTEQFSHLVEVLIRIFDHLGAVLHIAKHEMVTKTESLKAAAATHRLLADVVAADVKAGRATVKDSCARNLHRLVHTITFVRVLLEQFSANKKATAKEAAQKAYEQSLSPIHPYMIRTAVWASLYALPSREAFMAALGETEESASGKAVAIIQHSKALEARVLRLFDGIKMPTASMTANLMSGLFGKSTPPETTAPTAAAH